MRPMRVAFGTDEKTEVSEAVRGLGRGYELHRICFPAEVKEEVYRLYHSASPSSHAVANRGS